MIKKIRKFFGFIPKNAWVSKNIFNYGLSCRSYGGGTFSRSRNEITCYYNGVMESDLKQLKERVKEMSFEKGFWFLRTKAKELNYNFHYEKVI